MYWNKFLEGNPTRADFDKLLDSYKSCLDFPAAACYKELLDAYPGAKVILTYREPDSWATSVMETVWNTRDRSRNLWLAPWFMRFRRTAHAVRTKFFNLPQGQSYKPLLEDHAAISSAYKAWNQRVIDAVPRGQLLMFHPNDGWEPLCQFLGVPVPDKPFPKVNDTGNFQQMQKKRLQKYMLLDLCIIGAAVTAVAALASAAARRG